MTEDRDRWYKDKVFYQIWPRSFCDGNGDGIGDLEGVLGKLDYLESLGVDGIWFSPLYPSPNADYGYDVSDYRSINPEFGDLETFRRVLDGAHERGLKVLMDLVINHTSTEHPWFKAARADKNSPYHDYYFWCQGRGPDTPPNDWDSLFCGKAWGYEPAIGEWYLHLFCRDQADLNMGNPQVRKEIKDIMRFWLNLGVDGFREDVITFISKAPGLPNDPLMPAAKGLRFYNQGPHLHEYLAEFKRDVLDDYDCVTVGEAPLITPHTARKLIAEGPDQVLDMVFHLQHMEADCHFSEFDPQPFSLRKLKRAFSSWQTGLGDDAWDTLYLENHDRQRVISRYGSEEYRVTSGKMLAISYLFQRGTPFVYQGQEIGMTNIALDSIDEYKDVSTKNNYVMLCEKHSPAEALRIVQRGSRDSGRTPVQWSAAPQAGFTTGTPWFAVNANYVGINVAAQENDPDSLLNFYRTAIALRKRLAIVHEGSYREYDALSDKLFVYERATVDQRLLSVCSFTAEPVRFEAPTGYQLYGREPILANYPDAPLEYNGFLCRPFEARVYLLEV